MGAERALARQQLNDFWSNPPAAHSGTGGTSNQDKVIDTKPLSIRKTCQSVPLQRLNVVASKTWVGSAMEGGWALTLLRYDYDTGEPYGTPVVYPSNPSPTNFFVPTAMELIQRDCFGGGDGPTSTARIIMTGYRQATEFGNTDYHTVCWGGDLGIPIWSMSYSRPGLLSTDPDLIDEFPVDIASAQGWNYNVKSGPVQTDIVGITGNTWNGGNWDVQSLFYDVNNGQLLETDTIDFTAGGLLWNDNACGINLYSDPFGQFPNCRVHIVGTSTLVSGTSPANYIWAIALKSDEGDPGAWTFADSATLYNGASLTANAITGLYSPSSPYQEKVFVAGRTAGIDSSDMLLVSFDLANDVEDHATFSYNGGPGAFRFGEALALDYFPGGSGSGLPSFLALAGYSYRDATRTTDAIVCLYDVGSGLTLRWSAWLNPSAGTEFLVGDVCSAVKIDHSRLFADPDNFFVYAAGQVPTSATDMNWKVAVFKSNASPVPENPDAKSPYANTLTLSGTGAGGDIPRQLNLSPFSDLLNPTHHHFIVVGDVWNGVTTGFDIKTRRYQFIEPQ